MMSTTVTRNIGSFVPSKSGTTQTQLRVATGTQTVDLVRENALSFTSLIALVSIVLYLVLRS